MDRELLQVYDVEDCSLAPFEDGNLGHPGLAFYAYYGDTTSTYSVRSGRTKSNWKGVWNISLSLTGLGTTMHVSNSFNPSQPYQVEIAFFKVTGPELASYASEGHGTPLRILLPPPFFPLSHNICVKFERASGISISPLRDCGLPDVCRK